MESDPDQLVVLTSTRTEFEAQAAAAALRAEGIEASVFAAAASGVQWEGGISNAVRVMVRREDAARAAELLRDTRRAARHIDWNDVDVGEPEDGAPAGGPPLPTEPRVGGLSPWLARVRLVGIVLIFMPLLASWMGQGRAWFGVLIALALIVSAWSVGTTTGAGPRPNASPREGRGSA